MKALLIVAAVVLLTSCKKEKSTATPGPVQLQFTIGATYQFRDNITAKESIQNGLDQIEIDAQKVVGNAVYFFKIFIVGNTQIIPGVYTFNKNDLLHSSWFSVQYGDELIPPTDFNLQISSYQNGYLDATFTSSQVSNGIINHLKVVQ